MPPDPVAEFSAGSEQAVAKKKIQAPVRVVRIVVMVEGVLAAKWRRQSYLKGLPPANLMPPLFCCSVLK